MGKKAKTKFIQRMFDNEMKKKGINIKYDNLKGYMDGYTEYKKYLMQRELEENTGTVNFKDTTQEKYAAVYNFELNIVTVMCFDRTLIPGATYTTCPQAIQEYVDKIGIDKFKKYIVGL